jgi:hypothetical protein
LLGELSNIVADNRDTLVELYQGGGGHWSSHPEQAVQRRKAPHDAIMFFRTALWPHLRVSTDPYGLKHYTSRMGDFLAAIPVGFAHRWRKA